MKGEHHEKMAEEVRRIAATFLEMEANNTSLITVTHVGITADSKQATVYITVFPESKEADTLNFVKRKRKELREYASKHLKVGRIPFLEVELDLGEKNRQKIDALLREADK